MKQKTKNGLIAVGTTLGVLALIYYIINNKKKNESNAPYNPFFFPNSPNIDPYSLVDKLTKIKEIQDFLTKNSQKWLFADSLVKGNDIAINTWYNAIQKNEPTFTYYDKTILTNRTIDTNSGIKK